MFQFVGMSFQDLFTVNTNDIFMQLCDLNVYVDCNYCRVLNLVILQCILYLNTLDSVLILDFKYIYTSV